jgi:hypothetical protein
MQNGTSNFVNAVTAAGGTWADPRILTDWDGAGYGGDATIDNLSLMAGSWEVRHHLDDGFPDSVTFISGVGVAQASADLGPPPAYLTNNIPMQVREFFSPYNGSSPLSGYDRDVAPVTIDHGVIGAGGPERIRIFTGQMTDLPIQRGEAKLNAVSSARLALKNLVQPPAVYGYYQGANATWAITYALQACGLYASPPPQEGCRWWVPMHGSIRPFLPATNHNVLDVVMEGSSGSTGSEHLWVKGPFVMGTRFGHETDNFQRMRLNTSGDGIQLEPGTDLTTQAGSTGKFEFWVLGSVTDFDAQVADPSLWVNISLTNANGTWVDVGIDADSVTAANDRKPYVWINDGTTNNMFRHSTAIPTDGEWHFVGLAWKIAGASSKRWINLDGVVETSTTAFSTAGLPTTEGWSNDMPACSFRMPLAEVQLTSGALANPDNHPWLVDIDFEPDAIVTPSVVELASIAELVPREAWELIATYAQAELASLRTNEDDVVEYLGLSHWVQDEQQAVAEVVSTNVNAGPVDITIDPTKTRNTVQVNFSESFNVDTFTLVAAIRDPVPIEPGVTLLTVPFIAAATELRGFSFTNITAADTVEPTNTNTIAVNSSSSGTGTYATSGQVLAEVLEWNPGSVLIQVTNLMSVTQYLANDKGWASLTLAAKSLTSQAASVMDANELSVATRGARGLIVEASAIQRRTDARRLARDLKMALRKPVPTVEGLREFGDPRRQPGDLVLFEDPSVTRASGQWRRQSITHIWDADTGAYVQESIIRPTEEIGIWGQSTWGNCLWGKRSEL